MKSPRVTASLLMGLLLACGASEPSGPPNVLLVVFDTTRFDDWTLGGGSRAVTPTLARLAERGVRFTNAWSIYPETVGSHVTLFTGHSGVPLGASDEHPLRDPRYAYAASSLFTVLADAGYRTYAVSGNPNLGPLLREALGAIHDSRDAAEGAEAGRARRELARYGEHRPQDTAPSEAREIWQILRRFQRRDARAVNVAVESVLEEHAAAHADTPFLLFVNYNDAHAPFFPYAPFDERFLEETKSAFNGNTWSNAQRRDPLPVSPAERSVTAEGLSEADLRRARQLHLGELAYADEAFGRLLDALDRRDALDNTLIVCVSDHGELFGEYGRIAHAGEATPELMHVPLLLVLPGSEFAGRVVTERVDMRDVKPTVLAFLGIADTASRGRNLLAHLRGEALAASLTVPHFQNRRGNTPGPAIGGLDARTEREHIEALRALGYIE